LTFVKSKTYIDPSVKELGARVRIAKKANEIESPTGMAFSGEVEDFKTQITHPPKGEFKDFMLRPRDAVLLSSHTIPGNEKAVI